MWSIKFLRFKEILYVFTRVIYKYSCIHDFMRTYRINFLRHPSYNEGSICYDTPVELFFQLVKNRAEIIDLLTIFKQCHSFYLAVCVISQSNNRLEDKIHTKESMSYILPNKNTAFCNLLKNLDNNILETIKLVLHILDLQNTIDIRRHIIHKIYYFCICFYLTRDCLNRSLFSLTLILKNKINVHYISSLSLAMPHLHMGVSADSQYLSHLTNRYRVHFRYFIHRFHKTIEFVAKCEQCLIHITLIINKFRQVLCRFK